MASGNGHHDDDEGAGFFDLDDNDGDDGDCLEPPSDSTIDGDLDDKMSNLRTSDDPAIVTTLFPVQFPQPPPKALTLEELERDMRADAHKQQLQRQHEQQLQHQQQLQQLHHQHQQQLHHQQQQLQYQQHLQQQHVRMQQQQVRIQQHMAVQQQQIRQQQQYAEQQRVYQQQQHYHQQQQSHFRQQQHFNNRSMDQHHGRRTYNFSHNRNHRSFDDKDRETFGDDFVSDHQHHQAMKQQQLIMPGHVHTLRILRGARDHHEPTGIPALDMQRGHRTDVQQPEWILNQEFDEYSGLMTQRDRQWIINIQLNQLKDEHDYYYTVFSQKKKAREEGIDLLKGRKNFFGDEDDIDDFMMSNNFKHNGETALLLKSESVIIDSPRDEYTPRQFENSLGKLQAITVKAPRKIIDVGHIADPDTSGSSGPKDTRNYKKTLMELETLYNMLIEVEDCEKKLAALPTGTSLRAQIEQTGKDAIRRLAEGLITDSKLKRFLNVRKGKALIMRALRWVDPVHIQAIVLTLIQNFPLAIKKDRDDAILPKLWSAGIGKHVSKCKSAVLLNHYLAIICQGQPIAIKTFATTPVGTTVILTLIQRLGSILPQGKPEERRITMDLLTTLDKKLPDGDRPCRPIEPVAVDLRQFGLDGTFNRLNSLVVVGNEN